MPNIYETIGRRIRQERVGRHLSLEELAEKAETTASFLGQIERGERKLSVATLEKVALGVGLTPGDLMRASASMHGPSWEDRIAGLVRNQPTRRKILLFKTLKYLFRNLRSSAAQADVH